MNSFLSQLLALCALTLLLCNAVSAQEILLKNLVLDNVAGDIQLRFGVEVEALDHVEDLLHDGVTITMTSESRLIRTRSFVWDKTLEKSELEFELKEDPLSRTYVLTDIKNEKEMKNKDLGVLIQSNWSSLTMSLGNWNDLPQGVKYAMNLQVVLKRANVPVWLKAALFFWSWDVVDQKHYRMDFLY